MVTDYWQRYISIWGELKIDKGSFGHFPLSERSPRGKTYMARARCVQAQGATPAGSLFLPTKCSHTDGRSYVEAHGVVIFCKAGNFLQRKVYEVRVWDWQNCPACGCKKAGGGGETGDMLLHCGAMDSTKRICGLWCKKPSTFYAQNADINHCDGHLWSTIELST